MSDEDLGEFDRLLKRTGQRWPAGFKKAAIEVNDTMDLARRMLNDNAKGNWTGADLVAVTRLLIEEERANRELGDG